MILPQCLIASLKLGSSWNMFRIAVYIYSTRVQETAGRLRMCRQRTGSEEPDIYIT
uniref:Uncharacterized protein n=1 Tax=Burkholderia sp. (strain CCGE1003) TaxID=640512 RepID=E1T565_BURSG